MSVDWTAPQYQDGYKEIDKTKNRWEVVEGEFVKITTQPFHNSYELFCPQVYHLVCAIEVGTICNAFTVKEINHETGECLITEVTTGVDYYCEYPFLKPSDDYSVFSMV